MIQQPVFQIGETASRIGENTSKTNETSKGTIKESQDVAPVFVDTKTAKILHNMGGKNNPQLKQFLLIQRQPKFFIIWGVKLILK